MSVSATRPTAAPGTCSKPDSSEVSGATPSGAEPPAEAYAPPPMSTAAMPTATTLRRYRWTSIRAHDRTVGGRESWRTRHHLLEISQHGASVERVDVRRGQRAVLHAEAQLPGPRAAAIGLVLAGRQPGDEEGVSVGGD